MGYPCYHNLRISNHNVILVMGLGGWVEEVQNGHFSINGGSLTDMVTHKHVGVKGNLPSLACEIVI